MQGGKNRSEDRPLLKNRAAGLRRSALQEREEDPSTALGMTTEGERRAGTMYRAPTPRPCMSFAARRLWPPKGVCKPRNGCAKLERRFAGRRTRMTARSFWFAG